MPCQSLRVVVRRVDGCVGNLKVASVQFSRFFVHKCDSDGIGLPIGVILVTPHHKFPNLGQFLAQSVNHSGSAGCPGARITKVTEF